MDVVCKGSSVKGCPGKTTKQIKRRAQHPSQQDCPGLQTYLGTSDSLCATGSHVEITAGVTATTQQHWGVGDKRGTSLRSPSFGISAINNLGT